MSRTNWVYILTNRYHTVLYVGSTSDLGERMEQHASQSGGFTTTYRATKLVWFEEFSDYDDAIAFEHKLKRWRRQWKIDLIEENNPDWEELEVPYS